MPLLAVEHLRPMRGGAQAHLMRAGDGCAYVVKFRNNPQHRRVLANELLAARLARAAGLPVPEAAIIDVSADLIAASPAMVVRQGGRVEPCAAGLAFGSRLPFAAAQSGLPIYDFLPEVGLGSVSNLADFAGMLLFDKWTCNCDGRQVIFYRPKARERLRVEMIDQGFCFNAGDWNFPDSPLRGIYTRSLVYRHVTGWESFEPWLSRIEGMAPERIFAIGEEIPPAWYGAWEDLQRLLETLVQRRVRVRELVWMVKESSRAPFENWCSDRTRGSASHAIGGRGGAR